MLLSRLVTTMPASSAPDTLQRRCSSPYSALPSYIDAKTEKEAARIHEAALSQLQSALDTDLKEYAQRHRRASSADVEAEHEDEHAATEQREQREQEIAKAMEWLGEHMTRYFF